MQTKLVFVVYIFLIGLVVGQEISKTISYAFGGGSPQCTTCGSKAGEFACSNDVGDWHGGKRDFLDPLSYEDYRNGYILTKVNVILTGTYDCYGRSEGSVINVALNDELIEIKAKASSYKCECGRCDGQLNFLNNFNVGGFPGYRYGTYNTLSIFSFNNAICLKDALVNLTYTKPHSNSTSFFLDFNTDNNTCTACIGTPGKFQCANTGSRLTKGFHDSLPPKTIATGITLQWYSKSGGQYQSIVVTSFINDQSVSSDNIANLRYNAQPYCNDCGGRTVSTSSLYLAGFPGYNYGGDNTLTFVVGGSYNILCISRVQISIQYHFKS